MPRYFFHIREHASLEKDLSGFEFDSPEIAHTEAVKAAREIAAEKVKNGEIIDGQSFVVVDEAGAVIAEVPFKSVIRFD